MDDLLLADSLDFLGSEPSVNGTAPIDAPFVAARALAAKLRGRNSQTPPRTRVGILEIAPSDFGQESQLAGRLGAHTVSLAHCVLKNAPASSEWLKLNAMRVLESLDALASEAISADAPGDCRLVTHADLVLGALSTPERALFWREAFSNLPHRPRSLIIAMPQAGSTLPQGDDWKQWQDAARAADSA